MSYQARGHIKRGLLSIHPRISEGQCDKKTFSIDVKKKKKFVTCSEGMHDVGPAPRCWSKVLCRNWMIRFRKSTNGFLDTADSWRLFSLASCNIFCKEKIEITYRVCHGFRPALSNLVANRHMWRQGLLMWRQAQYLQFHIYWCFEKTTKVI